MSITPSLGGFLANGNQFHTLSVWLNTHRNVTLTGPPCTRPGRATSLIVFHVQRAYKSL